MHLMMNAKSMAAPTAAPAAANDNRQAPHIVRATRPIVGKTLNPDRKYKEPSKRNSCLPESTKSVGGIAAKGAA
jgi:hypothetical protein